MKKVGLIAMPFAVVACILLWRAWSEPSYAGRPVSYWAGHLEATLVGTNGNSVPAWRNTVGAQAEAAEACRALRAIGGPCLPVLLRRLDTKQDSRLKVELIVLGLKSKLVSRSWLAEHTSEWIRAQALTGILALGPVAKPAVGNLMMLSASKDPYVGASARYALGKLESEKLNEQPP